MNAIDREKLNQGDIPADLIDRIRRFRCRKFTIRQIADLVGWSKGRSTAALRRIAGPMPKAAVGESSTSDEILRRHVGCLYGGRW